MPTQLVRISYEFRDVDQPTAYDQAQPWKGQLGDFDCTLENGRLDAIPKVSLASIQDGRALLEPLLRAWELETELQTGIRVEFRFGGGEVIDPSNPRTKQVHGAAEISLAGELSAKVARSNHPPPPKLGTRQTALVAELVQRWRDVRYQRERLLVGAYWILTRVEEEYGNRDAAAKSLGISKKVLSKLGELSVRNDPSEGRKFEADQPALSPAENRWIRECLRQVVMRIALVEGGVPGLSVITLNDLPAI